MIMVVILVGGEKYKSPIGSLHTECSSVRWASRARNWEIIQVVAVSSRPWHSVVVMCHTHLNSSPPPRPTQVTLVPKRTLSSCLLSEHRHSE
jgi:hypothetical protein